jgi:hypothetical protein
MPPRLLRSGRPALRVGLRRIATELHVGVGTVLRVLGEEHRAGAAG